MEAYEPANKVQTVKRTPVTTGAKEQPKKEEVIDKLKKLVKGEEDVKKV